MNCISKYGGHSFHRKNPHSDASLHELLMSRACLAGLMLEGLVQTSSKGTDGHVYVYYVPLFSVTVHARKTGLIPAIKT